jgi:hypothetical protein
MKKNTFKEKMKLVLTIFKIFFSSFLFGQNGIIDSGFVQFVTSLSSKSFNKYVASIGLMLVLLVGNLSFGQTYYNMASGDYNENFISCSTPKTGVK